MNRFMIHVVEEDPNSICLDLAYFGETIDGIKERLYADGFTEKDIEGTYEIRCINGEDVSLPERIGG